MANITYNNIAYGETDKSVLGRPDSESYRFGVSKLENFNVGLLGGVKRREGLEKCADLPNIEGIADSRCRIIEYSQGTDREFIIIFGDRKVIVYDTVNQEYITNDSIQGYIESPYSIEDLEDVQYAQNSECMVFAHKNYPVYQLVIIDTSCIFSQISFIYDNRIRDDVEGKEEYDYTHLFKENDYPSCVAFCANRLILASTINHPYRLFFSRPFNISDFTTFDTYQETQSVFSEDKYNIALEKTRNFRYISKAIENAVLSATNVMNSSKVIPNASCITIAEELIEYLKSNEVIVEEQGIITKGEAIYNAMNINPGSLDIPLSSFRYTYESALRDLVNAGEVSIEFNGDDIIDIEIKTEDAVSPDCAIILDLGGNKNDTINWIGINQNIIVGTDSSEWVIDSKINAIEQSAKMVSGYGSCKIQSMQTSNKILYIQENGTIRSIGYDPQTYSYPSEDLNVYNKEILKAGVKNIIWQRVPMPRAFALCKDGCIASLTYNTLNGIRGWSKWSFNNAKAISIACVDSDNGQDVYAFMEYMAIDSQSGEEITKYGLFEFNKELTTDELIGDFESILLTNPIESSNYSSILNFKNGKVLGVRVDETQKFYAGWTNSYLKEIDASKSDILQVPLPSAWSKDLRLCIKSYASDSLNILAIVANMEIS